MADKYPEILADMVARFAAILEEEEGLPTDRSHHLAVVLVEDVRAHLGGQKLYLPKGVSFECSMRDRDIAERWNGRNTRELCREYGITESRLLQIVASVKRRPKDSPATQDA